MLTLYGRSTILFAFSYILERSTTDWSSNQPDIRSFLSIFFTNDRLAEWRAGKFLDSRDPANGFDGPWDAINLSPGVITLGGKDVFLSTRLRHQIASSLYVYIGTRSRYMSLMIGFTATRSRRVRYSSTLIPSTLPGMDTAGIHPMGPRRR